MAVSHKARYCNGFPNFFSDTDVLKPSFYPMVILSILSVPTVSGHKIGHILFRAREEPSLQMVSDSHALSRRQISGCEEAKTWS
jgi:hypothetical protein